MLEAGKKEMVESVLRVHSGSVKSSRKPNKNPQVNASKTEKLKAFINEDVVTGIYKDSFFDLILSDVAKFTNEYRSARKDSNLQMGQWHGSDEYDGQVREITFRSLCTTPMCPPVTAMTEYQHVVLSPDKKTLVFETVQQAHDVPFGSHFEIHCRWGLETVDENSCTIDIKVGAHFKKWCVMQSKIKTGAIDEYRKEVEVMLDVALSLVKSSAPGDKTDEADIPTTVAETSS